MAVEVHPRFKRNLAKTELTHAEEALRRAAWLRPLHLDLRPSEFNLSCADLLGVLLDNSTEQLDEARTCRVVETEPGEVPGGSTDLGS